MINTEMNNKEIEESNDKIIKHNKFCFMKKQIPLYKRIVPLSEAITYAIISMVLLALPTAISVNLNTPYATGPSIKELK